MHVVFYLLSCSSLYRMVPPPYFVMLHDNNKCELHGSKHYAMAQFLFNFLSNSDSTPNQHIHNSEIKIPLLKKGT